MLPITLFERATLSFIHELQRFLILSDWQQTELLVNSQTGSESKPIRDSFNLSQAIFQDLKE